MKSEIVKVTPRLAREWLKHNTKNRPIRPSHVETLRASFERGEYVMTHQGVAFAEDGELIDGQHRLSAIALLSDGCYFPMLVSTGMHRNSTFAVVDATQCKRTTADVLGVDRGLGECANFFAKLYLGRGNGLTPTFVAPFSDFIAREYHDLNAFCSSAVKTWSSAPVRAAAIVSMKLADPDHARLVYRAMVLADFSSMPPAAQAVFRAHLKGAVRAAASYDIFARGLKVFDPKFSHLQKVQISDQARVIASVREYLEAEVYGVGKKKAPAVTRGAKGVQPDHYRLEGL